MGPAFRFSGVRSYGFAIGIAGAAVALQWLVIPVVGTRIPFLFFLAAVAACAFRAGLGPALLVLIVGAINAAFTFEPRGSPAVLLIEDLLAIAIYVLMATLLMYAGARVRALYFRAQSSESMLTQTRSELQRQVNDLEQLHHLSERLARSPQLEQQLSLVLETLVAMHGAQRGLVSIYDKKANRLTIATSIGLSQRALEKLEHVRGGEGATWIACTEARRAIVRDTHVDPHFANYRDLAAEEDFRAVHSTPLLSHSGEILGAISVHFREPREPTEREIRLADLCARKASVYLERAQAEAHAAESDQRFRSVLEASAVPFSVLSPVFDENGSIVDFSWSYVNQAAATVLQQGANAVFGQRLLALPGTASDPVWFDHYVAVALKGEVREFEIHSNSTGTDSWFHVVASPLGSQLAVWFADVSERKRHEIELRIADRRKDEFLATLAHELRNPLAPIRQATMLVKKTSITPAQKQWCLDVIDRQVQHMSLLLEDLLDVSRITRGVLQLRKQPTSLTALIEAAVETARPVIESKRHTLQLDVQQETAQLDVDPLRMSQVISNLLTNAAKYTNAGGTIDLVARVVDTDLVLTVSDNGIGIAKEELRTIFAMFSQVKSAQDRSEGGLGIGLALTKGLIELHGGSIEAQSRGPGAGSTFSVKIPNALANRTASGAQSGPDARPVLSRRILVADDNRDAAESLAMLLRSDGHQVTLVHDGEAALAAFGETKPDVVLLDIGMPRMSGYEVAKRIRATSNGRDPLLIAITGWGQSTDRARSAAAGFDHHLTKPVDYSEVVQLLLPNSRRTRLSASSAVE